MTIRNLDIGTPQGLYEFHQKALTGDHTSELGVEISTPEIQGFISRVTRGCCSERITFDQSSTGFRDLILDAEGDFAGLTLNRGPFEIKLRIADKALRDHSVLLVVRGDNLNI